MPHSIFSDSWARACGERINARSGYRVAGATWEVQVVLRMEGPGEEVRRVHFDLGEGRCRSARAGTPDDETDSRYILSGRVAAWEQVLTGKAPALLAIMTGKLKLAKGNIAELLPHAEAAKELVLAAAEVDASFPA